MQRLKGNETMIFVICNTIPTRSVLRKFEYNFFIKKKLSQVPNQPEVTYQDQSRFWAPAWTWQEGCRTAAKLDFLYGN